MRTEQTSVRVKMRKLEGDCLTPILLFKRMTGKQKFLLESSSKEEGSGRYSFMGMNPLKSYQGKAGQVVETIHTSAQAYVHEGELFTLLKRLMPRITETSDFPFVGGAVGYVSYDATQPDRSKQTDTLGLPLAYFNTYDTVIIFDHLLNEVTLVHTQITAEHRPPDLDALAKVLVAETETQESSFTLSPYQSSVTQVEFEKLVERAKTYIETGEVEQIVLSRRVEAEFTGDPFSVYRKLRKRNPSPYMYYMEFEDHTVIGTSPESLISVKGQRVVTNPIAGTRRRGVDEAEDKALERELRADAKELAEHNMLVELSKREMNLVCDASTVCVTQDMETVRYEHVMHLVSEVEGTLMQGLHALDALKMCMPAGTVSGSPKKRAMELIDELESLHRGIYGGAIGYIGFNGTIDFALTIRTMLIKAGKAYVQAGAGIVAASDPTSEYLETVHKARSLLEIT